MNQKVHTGLSLVLIWSVALGFAVMILLQINDTDGAFLFASDDVGASAASYRN